MRSELVCALLGAALLGATLLVAGCGSSVDESKVAAARSSANAAFSSAAAASATTAAAPALPTAAELDARIKGALDPSLPDDVRLALIQDGEAFRPAIPDLYKALQDNPNATYQVVDPVFDNHDGTLTATVQLDKDGTGANVRTANVHFVLIDEEWKLSRVDLCGLLRSADYHTPACG